MSGGRTFAIVAAAFLVAAALVAAVNAAAPMPHGWWLVAYLALVGGISQLLLGPGLMALARRGDAAAGGRGAWRARLALWNAGTVIVAVADLADAPGGVLAGSVMLTAALLLYASGLHEAIVTAHRPTTGWARAYVGLLAFLAISVVIGTVLAYRPG